MKNLIMVCWIAIALFVGNAYAKDMKIGVLDFARILEESPQAEKARQSMQEEFAPREKELLETQKKIRSLEDRLARDGAIMSESERAKLERQIISDKREFKRGQDEFRDDINFKRNELLENLQRKLVISIRSYAEKEGFDLLLAEGVVYTTDALNVTNDVLEQLRKDAK